MLMSYGDRPSANTRCRTSRAAAEMAHCSLPERGERHKSRAIALNRVGLMSRVPGAAPRIFGSGSTAIGLDA